MGNSYRIRTTPGEDGNIILNLNQDFDSLEILSLKIRQSEVYNRMCSDYGVVAGRVYSNSGYGIPNVKLSIFIPITSEDELDPIISDLYPYKTITDVNDDGYKYNLLPYRKSHSGHSPTGTFPDREDVLLNESVLEVYEKYYKFTVTTNNSGDFLIFGVPLGSQTLVMNVDLSDIGEFSLTPDDLIRMGLATEDQFDGNKFRSSTNIDTLPQIITLYKDIDVVPFWGEPETCQIGITRVDFDLTREANVNIQPVSIFIGSLVSNDDKNYIKTKGLLTKGCNVTKKFGENCDLISNQGQIIAIRQTIGIDENGDPILERADLPNGGNVIDGDGAWVLEVPMNLDYVYTDEFGNRVISNDPKLGIPTKGKYRFKAKWSQPSTVTEGIRRGYFLIPNVREYGWSSDSNISSEEDRQKSYAFSLSWDDYVDKEAAINCEDFFFEFDYNNIYTVSGLIDNHKVGNFRKRFLGIKSINDPDCEQINKFPTNDAVYNPNFLATIISILFTIIQIVLYAVIVPYHIIIAIIRPIIRVIAFFSSKERRRELREAAKRFGTIPLPMITYPNCDNCECGVEDVDTNEDTEGNGFMFPFNLSQSYDGLSDYLENLSNGYFIAGEPRLSFVKNILSGYNEEVNNSVENYSIGVSRIHFRVNDNDDREMLYSNDLPLGERINLFNTKSKYYEGLNQISVSVEPSIPNNIGINHFDNVLVFITYPEQILQSGDILSLVNPSSSNDPNVNKIEGTIRKPENISLVFGDQNNRTLNRVATYSLPSGGTEDIMRYEYPSDIEYYQVITGMTLLDFYDMASLTPLNGSFVDVLNSTMEVVLAYEEFGDRQLDEIYNIEVLKTIPNWRDLNVFVIQKGVDPYSYNYDIEYGLGKIFGFSNENEVTVRGSYKINQPVVNGDSNSEILFYHDLVGLTNDTTSNGLNINFSSNFFSVPSSAYTSYESTLIGYYSSIDNKLLSSETYLIRSDNTDTNFSDDKAEEIFVDNTIDVMSIGDGNRFVINGLPNANVANYDADLDGYVPDSIVGGSFVFSLWNGGDIPLDETQVNNINVNSFYFSPIYNKSNSPVAVMQMTNNNNLILRSDRLPSSDVYVSPTETNNAFLLQQNYLTTVYDKYGGIIAQYEPPSRNDIDDDDYSGVTLVSSVLNTFDCANMVDIDCYELVDGILRIKESCENGGDRVEFGKGCYVLVKRALTDIPRDFGKITEWGARYRFFYKLCQGIVSESFTNNWVNGVLYAYPFKLNRTFDNNEFEYDFCNDLIIRHEKTNNFYYRSSPYNEISSTFVADRNDNRVDASNNYNLKYPTTIMNLGPKESFLWELIFDDKYYGYIIDNMVQSSYKDNSDILNLFIISRFARDRFRRDLLNPATNVYRNFFQREGPDSLNSAGRIDGDYAQAIATHTQFGVVFFDVGNYVTSGSDSEVYISNDPEPKIGIFFRTEDEYLNFRSLISNREMVFSNNKSRKLGSKTQIVPFYRWKILNGNDFIFGNDLNNWNTDFSFDSSKSGIIQKGYQDLGFGDASTEHYLPNLGSKDRENLFGYIYSKDNNGNFILQDVSENNPMVFGAPWYFYFGLFKGRTAIDKFFIKYVFDNTLRDEN